MDARRFCVLFIVMVMSPTCLSLIEVPQTRENLHLLRKFETAGAAGKNVIHYISEVFYKLDEKIDKLNQKIDHLNQKTEKLDQRIEYMDMKTDTDIKELREIFLDRRFQTSSHTLENPAANLKLKRSLSDRYRRDANGLHVSNVFVTLYEKSLETSADVKTLLGKTEEVLESASECGKIPSIIEQIHYYCKKNEAVSEKPRSCLELLKQGHTLSGTYTLYVETLEKDIEVYCDQDTDGGGWIVFQRRKDGSVDFYRDWADYKIGFGNVLGEFWLGLDYINDLTADGCHELRIDMSDFEHRTRYAKYDCFKVGPEWGKYVLTATGYSGDAEDSMEYHSGSPFSTKDVDNDAYGSSCAQRFKGGWWYASCHNANLNGLYLGGVHKSYADGIIWDLWKGDHYSLKFVEMKFREKPTE